LPDLLGTGDLFNVAAGNNGTAEYYKQQQLVIGSYTLCQQTIQANDFLPHLPAMSIPDGAIDAMLTAYRCALPSLGGYVTLDGRLSLRRRGPPARFASDLFTLATVRLLLSSSGVTRAGRDGPGVSARWGRFNGSVYRRGAKTRVAVLGSIGFG